MKAAKRCALLTLLGATASLLGASPALAGSPWWHLSTSERPSTIAPGGEGVLSFRVLNIGDASVTPCVQVAAGTGEFDESSCSTEAVPAGSGEFEAKSVVLAVTLPAGFAVEQLGPGEPNATLHKFPELEIGSILCSEPAPREVRCSYPGAFGSILGPLLPFEFIELQVTVEATGPVSGPSVLEVSGGGTQASDLRSTPSLGGPAPSFGVEAGGFAARPEEEGGATDARAGSHPFQLTTDLALNQNADTLHPPALVRNLAFELPPGLLANATAVGRCSELDFLSKGAGSEFNDRCQSDAAIGVADLTIFQTALSSAPVQTYPVPVFNLATSPGEPARFGFYFNGIPVTIDFSLRSDGDYGATATVRNVTQIANLISTSLTIWGAPGDPAHDASRGWGCLAAGFYQAFGKPVCIPSGEVRPKPFLQMPTSCQTPFTASVEGLSWPTQAFPGGAVLPRAEYSLGDVDGSPLAIAACDRVPFEPTIAAEATRTAASPTGLNFDIDFADPGIENADGIVNSQIKRAVITLPPGFTTNPAVANGLGACATAQYGAETLSNQGCPESSRVGTVEIESPLVEPKIDGSLYVAKQGDNVSQNNLLTVYLVAKSPELGVIVKQALKVTPDPQTGRLTSEVDNVPRLPFSHLHLAFRSGPRAPLITPATCGHYAAEADLYPWSAPTVPLHREATLMVDSGNGGPCVDSESQLPDHPTLSAGTVSPIAGAYSPFLFEVKREDGEQKLGAISATLPEGLLGKLAGVAQCSDPQIARAQSLSGEGQAATELASPSCPADSQVGVVSAATGAGPQPYYVQGKAYLAGPYKGAPLSLAIITPAVVGPFDLGDVVIRAALYVDERTAQIHAVSDPIPTILHGLPTVIRSVSLQMNRPQFTLNPTSCEPKQVSGQATSTLGAVAPLSERFQVGACGALAFKPTLKLQLNGATRRLGHPALKAVLTAKPGEANIARAQVNLPHGEFLDQGNLNKTCTKPVLLAGNCPKSSVYGKAKAWSPLLEAPLQGSVYLVGGFGYKLPALVAELDGQIKILLVGKIDSGPNKGIRSTFEAVPDAPVSRFVLEMKGGKKYGLLENSENLCRAPKEARQAVARFTGQSGKVEQSEPVVANQCGKAKGKKKKGKAGPGQRR